ncbi:MAG TPA: hypothetical protein VFA76_01950 [Terriglobales bacterium]|nr:hypothetical protein [Terriglobales bacterium]
MQVAINYGQYEFTPDEVSPEPEPETPAGKPQYRNTVGSEEYHFDASADVAKARKEDARETAAGDADARARHAALKQDGYMGATDNA